MKELLAKPNFRNWLAIVGASTLLLGAAYVLVQQSTRLAANDLPLATAQSIRHQLNAGTNPVTVVPAVKTNLRADSTVFVTITDTNQQVLASSADLDGHVPLPPKGVFAYTKTHGTDHFSWEPTNDVRLATRVVTYSSAAGSGYIVTGQGLYQAENRIEVYTWLVFTVWLIIIAWVTIVLLYSPPAKAKRSSSRS